MSQVLIKRPLSKRTLLFGFFALLVLPGSHLLMGQVQSRTQEIQSARADKMAHLWPERESPLVQQVNTLVERGLLEGAQTGQGANGWQVVLGGMRSGQGMTVGLGYRRSDLFKERLGFRTTFRGTIKLASLVDFQLFFPRLQTERAFLNFYARYENSPQLDFYGKGPDSSEDDRTSYRGETVGFAVNAGYRLFGFLGLGITGGMINVHTGPGKRGGVPSTDEIFDQDSAPGLGEDTYYASFGGFMFIDYLDSRVGPRSGGLYGYRARQHTDMDLKKFSFRQVDFEAQQYIPYFDKTRVIALRALVTLAFENSGNTIPFYAQPKLGGNDSLRGFQRYRFYDKHALVLTAEHRWHAFSGLDMALFVDAGKVASRKADLDFNNLEVSYGFGFRFKLNEAYFMRIDFAGGREGLRFMWTFSDIFKVREQGSLQF
jgi:outer membrane protein assembly factor BamA